MRCLLPIHMCKEVLFSFNIYAEFCWMWPCFGLCAFKDFRQLFVQELFLWLFGSNITQMFWNPAAPDGKSCFIGQNTAHCTWVLLSTGPSKSINNLSGNQISIEADQLTIQTYRRTFPVFGCMKTWLNKYILNSQVGLKHWNSLAVIEHHMNPKIWADLSLGEGRNAHLKY